MTEVGARGYDGGGGAGVTEVGPWVRRGWREGVAEVREAG